MESHSCEKNRGEGALPTSALPSLPGTDDDSLRCRHIDALGRRCRMFVAAPQSSDLPETLQDQAAELCPHHAHLLFRRHRVREANAAELLASVSDFNDPAAVNRFLGNLLTLVAVKRVPRRDGMALAYISQLILNSQAAQDRKELVRLKVAELEDRREKHQPVRLIWDLPPRRRPDGQTDDQTQDQRPENQQECQKPDQRPGSGLTALDQREDTQANAGKAAPSEAPQPCPLAPAPRPSGSAQSINRAAAQTPPQAASAPAQPSNTTSPSALATPASGSGLPPAPEKPKPMPGFTLRREGHTVDWYAPASWNKPVRRRYPSSRWY